MEPSATSSSASALEALANTLVLGALLERLQSEYGGYALITHWTQGEFHHDTVVRVKDPGVLDGDVLVIATNCNGGVKEVLCFAEVPERLALWKRRCPTSPEFDGALPPLFGEARTVHWFDPCELLADDARSELLPEHRRRQAGGGWCKA